MPISRPTTVASVAARPIDDIPERPGFQITLQIVTKQGEAAVLGNVGCRGHVGCDENTRILP